MRRYELNDAEWELIADLFPHGRRKGRPWRDHRQVLDGMLWVLRSGAPWRDLPERYGPWQTVNDRFYRWRDDGTLATILERLQMKLDAEGKIDWDLWCIDGTNVRASRAAAGAGKKGGLTSRRTTHWVAREAAGARRSTWSLTVMALRSRRS